MERLVIVALGPGHAEDMTLQAADMLRRASHVLLRTGRHGAAEWLRGQGIPFETLDALYGRAEDFDALNQNAAAEVLRRLSRGALCYGVPDPLTDATVAALKAGGTAFTVVAGVTQADHARARALESPLPADDRVTIVPAIEMCAHRINPSLPLLVTELNSRLLAGEVKLSLLDVYAPERRVLFAGAVIPLDTLDRQAGYGHLSYAYVPQSPLGERGRYTFGDLLDIMARLRRPGDGCPWDREQTHETLREYALEEAYELVDAIDRGDMPAVADELGDVLLQVVFHAQVAKEHGVFAIRDVTSAICHKMITRHAHIFGELACETADDVLRSWEAIKKKEKGLQSSVDSMRDLPGRLPALMRAGKVQKKARQVGFDWDDPLEALQKVAEETDEVRRELEGGRNPEDELGDLLFAAVNAARLAGVQPELALGRATDKFIRRFERMEAAIAADQKRIKDMSLPEMDAYWDLIKRSEREKP
ncbi:MAG: nucleoside triphosphate pyrophosphohydrolase [Firmicutes bacterium]|nr:nucleoside triphosphate pyrophosphohydrolase [Bacillota bacterium]